MDMPTQPCSFEYNDEGELIIIFPDGTRDTTGLFPTTHERDAASAFIETTTGMSLLMRMRRMLLFDDRTGLLTAKAGKQHIERMLEHIENVDFTGAVSVIFIDLDNFKNVNKQHGHLTGDRILEWFAHILAKKTRGSDIVIRWAGDEFVIFTTHSIAPEDRRDLQREKDEKRVDPLYKIGTLLAQRIKTTMEASPVHIGRMSIEQRATFGVATMMVAHGDKLERVYERLFAKAEGLNNHAKLEGQRGEIHEAPLMFARD